MPPSLSNGFVKSGYKSVSAIWKTRLTCGVLGAAGASLSDTSINNWILGLAETLVALIKSSGSNSRALEKLSPAALVNTIDKRLEQALCVWQPHFLRWLFHSVFWYSCRHDLLLLLFLKDRAWSVLRQRPCTWFTEVLIMDFRVRPFWSSALAAGWWQHFCCGPSL